MGLFRDGGIKSHHGPYVNHKIHGWPCFLVLGHTMSHTSTPFFRSVMSHIYRDGRYGPYHCYVIESKNVSYSQKPVDNLLIQICLWIKHSEPRIIRQASD